MIRKLSLLAAALVSGCLAVPNRPDSPVPLVPGLDLGRFSGDWFVIGYVPTFLDRGAHNAIESYQVAEDGRILTTYRFRKDSFDGELKRMTPVGHVVPGTGNALWGMQFLPLFRSEYRVSYLAPDYSVTIIGRSDLDYAWLMSRSPVMADEDYDRYLKMMAGWGYDTSKLVRVPQRWPESP